MFNRTLITTIIVGAGIAISSGIGVAGSCPGQMFSAKNETSAPTSVAVTDISAFLSAAPWSEGVRVAAHQKGGEVWLDVTEFPSKVTAAAAARTAWLIGRVIDTDAGSVVFSDGGEGVFQIELGILKNIGCRFVIGEQAGENPIALMREFYDAVTHYDTGARVAPTFTGSLLGDTNAALVTNNEVFVPKWVLSAVK